jgi:hypothetical protein
MNTLASAVVCFGDASKHWDHDTISAVLTIAPDILHTRRDEIHLPQQHRHSLLIVGSHPN